MESIPTWIFPLLGLLFLITQFSRGYRTLKGEGRAIRPALPPDALFGESGASGCLETNLFARMSGASGVLLVSVTRTEFRVESAFPFNVLMPLYPPQCRVPVPALLNACQVDNKSVRITVPNEEGPPQNIRLTLKHPEQMVKVLARLGVRSDCLWSPGAQ